MIQLSPAACDPLSLPSGSVTTLSLGGGFQTISVDLNPLTFFGIEWQDHFHCKESARE